MDARLSNVPFPIKLILAGAAFLIALAFVPKISGWLGIAALLLWAAVFAGLLQACGLLPRSLAATFLGHAARFLVNQAAAARPVEAPRPVAMPAGAGLAEPVAEDRPRAIRRGMALLDSLEGADPALAALRADIDRKAGEEKDKRRLLGAGRALVVVVTGPPGVGKSTVLRAIADILYGHMIVEAGKRMEIEPQFGGRQQDWAQQLREGLDGVVIVDNANWLADGDPLAQSLLGDDFFRLVLDIGERFAGRLAVLVSIGEKELDSLSRRTGLREASRRLTVRSVHLSGLKPDLLIHLLRSGLASRTIDLPDRLMPKVRRLVIDLAAHQGEAFDFAEAMRRAVERLDEMIPASAPRLVTEADLELALDA